MNATITIKNRTYNVVQSDFAQHFDYKNGTFRLHVTDKQGKTKFAQFFNGEFELWDTPVKHTVKYGRAINMRK